MDFDISDEDIYLLIDAYVTRDSLKQIWKKYLEDKNQDSSLKNIQMLGNKLIKEKNIDQEVIKSLFNPSVTPAPNLKEWVLKTCKDLPSVEQLDKIEGGEEIINDIKKRFKFPKDTNPLHIGAINSDHHPETWCHCAEEEDHYTGFYHGMITCECHDDLPDRLDELTCDVCKRNFELEELHRFPYIDGTGEGGWQGCYCSKDCMYETCHINDIREEILCAIYFD